MVIPNQVTFSSKNLMGYSFPSRCQSCAEILIGDYLIKQSEGNTRVIEGLVSWEPKNRKERKYERAREEIRKRKLKCASIRVGPQYKIVLLFVGLKEESMDASSSFGSTALRGKNFLPKMQPTELEQRVSRSERNFLRPDMLCMKCGGFICWAEEEGRGESRGGLQSGSSMYKGRQRVGGGSPVEVAIKVDDVAELKGEMSPIISEVAEMRHEMRSLLIKIYDALKFQRCAYTNVQLALPLSKYKLQLLVLALADYQSMDTE
ncbi:LOW QUALITY PROTEIN: hypothetical protein Cgig2_012841 [Carnegiea gigantea]|uniref:Uncharacterized protein n=1 Tax=Carnegiea gigantea TaxID=171969 RepID=A0A9Q1QEU7_9CARY|nr:LOW QUALITY PROTEIN: hypothetical protein Cgig2_012841 [Carnegiea gigantea]